MFLVPRNSLCSVYYIYICMYTMYFMIREPCGTYLQVWYRVPVHVNRYLYSSHYRNRKSTCNKNFLFFYKILKYLDTDPFPASNVKRHNTWKTRKTPTAQQCLSCSKLSCSSSISFLPSLHFLFPLRFYPHFLTRKQIPI